MSRGRIERKTWLTISDGKVREKGNHITKDTPDAEYREVVMDGKKYEMWEIVDDFVEGFITNIEIKENEFGRQLEITMNDEQEEFCVRIRWDSAYASAFLQKAPNIRFEDMVKLLPYYFEKDKQARLVIQQGVEPVNSYYTKEDRHGMPIFPENGSKDDLAQWKLDVSRFMHEQLVKVILPKVAAADPLSRAASEIDPFADVVENKELDKNEPPLSKEYRQKNRDDAKAKNMGNIEEGDPGPGLSEDEQTEVDRLQAESDYLPF